MTVVMFAVIIVAALLVTMQRVIPFRIILGYATLIDVGVSSVLMVMFAGTFTGLMSAAMAGLVLALTLSAGRALIGYQRLRWRAGGVYVEDFPPKAWTWVRPLQRWLLRWAKAQANRMRKRNTWRNTYDPEFYRLAHMKLDAI